jgi:hypothetical protein
LDIGHLNFAIDSSFEFRHSNFVFAFAVDLPFAVSEFQVRHFIHCHNSSFILLRLDCGGLHRFNTATSARRVLPEAEKLTEREYLMGVQVKTIVTRRRVQNSLPLYTILAPGISFDTPWWAQELAPLLPQGAKRRAKEEEEDEEDEEEDDEAEKEEEEEEEEEAAPAEEEEEEEEEEDDLDDEEDDFEDDDEEEDEDDEDDEFDDPDEEEEEEEDDDDDDDYEDEEFEDEE